MSFTVDDQFQRHQRDRFLPPFYLGEGSDFQFLPQGIEIERFLLSPIRLAA